MKKVTCAVSTYGRWWLLEEMVQSFIEQDYKGPKEMIIMNDATDVKLVCDHPDIKIINMVSEAKYNSYKRDFAVGVGTGELCFTYDDDDIMLPHRLSTQVAYFDADPDLDYLQVNVAYFLNSNRIDTVSKNFFFASHMWKKRKYVSAVSDDPSEYDDTVMYRNLMETCDKVKVINEDNWTYGDIVHMYKWGCDNTIHHSGISLNAGEAEKSWKEMVRKDKRWRTGEVVIRPHLCRDYKTMAINFEKRNPKND